MTSLTPLSKRLGPSLPMLFLLTIALAACSTESPCLKPLLQYTLPGGGKCVTLGQHPQPPFANIRTTFDSYQAHSETMIVEDPHNPLHLVGGAKFFPSIAHYRFQVGYTTSFDGGCTWSDGGALPGFSADTTTSDPSFAFGPHHEVYAAVLNINDRQSGISVLKSTDNGKTFGQPVSVFGARPQDAFSDKPWITIDQTEGPHSGNVYVVWSYDHGGLCGNGNFCIQNLAFSRSTDGGKTFSPVRMDADILFSTSKDNGRAWSDPLRVNDDPVQDGANQFQPQIAVAPDGVVSITFFDTRRDPQQRRIDVYLAQSINHGASFLRNVRVTTQSWDPTVRAPADDSGLQFIGDYQGLAVDNLFVHPIWNDTRTGDQEVFTAAIPSVQP